MIELWQTSVVCYTVVVFIEKLNKQAKCWLGRQCIVLICRIIRGVFTYTKWIDLYSLCLPSQVVIVLVAKIVMSDLNKGNQSHWMLLFFNGTNYKRKLGWEFMKWWAITVNHWLHGSHLVKFGGMQPSEKCCSFGSQRLLIKHIVCKPTTALPL